MSFPHRKLASTASTHRIQLNGVLDCLPVVFLLDVPACVFGCSSGGVLYAARTFSLHMNVHNIVTDQSVLPASHLYVLQWESQRTLLARGAFFANTCRLFWDSATDDHFIIPFSPPFLPFSQYNRLWLKF